MKLYKYLLLALALYPVTGQAMQCQQAARLSLYEAADNGNKDVVELLLKAGAVVNQADKYGCTPLHKVVFKVHKDIVELLLKAGAAVNQADKHGCTPLYKAVLVLTDNKDVVKLLLKAGAAVNQADNFDCTPLSLAAYEGPQDIVELLVTHNAKIDQADINNARNTGREQTAAYLEKNKDCQQILYR